MILNNTHVHFFNEMYTLHYYTSEHMHRPPVNGLKTKWPCFEIPQGPQIKHCFPSGLPPSRQDPLMDLEHSSLAALNGPDLSSQP